MMNDEYLTHKVPLLSEKIFEGFLLIMESMHCPKYVPKGEPILRYLVV